jgi:thioredoxin 1
MLAILLYGSSCGENPNPKAPAGSQSPREVDDKSGIIELTSNDEFTKILGKEKIVVVDFNADWCGPCRMLKPILAELAREYTGKVTIVSVNVDHFQKLAGQHQISSIPAVFFFKSGKQEEIVVGLYPKETYSDLINRLLVN